MHILLTIGLAILGLIFLTVCVTLLLFRIFGDMNKTLDITHNKPPESKR